MGFGMPAPFPMMNQGLPGPSFGASMPPMMGSFPRPVMGSSMGNSSLYQSAAVAPVAAAPTPVQPSLYSSMMNLPTSSGSLYASAQVGPSIYASMGALPSFSMPPMQAIGESKPAIPQLTEGASTVGLMLWPGKTGELIITGIKDETSAAETELAVGDVIVSVDGESVEGMDATDVAGMMAGPTGSTLTITTANGVTCTVTRDVSAEEANATTVNSIKKSGSGASTSNGRQLSPMECQRFGVPMGSVWGESKAKPAQPKPSPSPAKPAAKKSSSAAPSEQGRLLTHAECSRYGVPYGSRMGPMKKKEAPKEPAAEEDNGHLL